MFSFDKVVEYAFLAALTGGVGFVVRFLAKISASLSEMKTNLAVAAKSIQDHDRRIGKVEDVNDLLDTRVTRLEARDGLAKRGGGG